LGQVVGNSGQRAFLWQNGKLTDLGALPGSDSSTATAINARGQAVGYSRSGPSGWRHAFLWQNGKMTELRILRSRESIATAINNRGQILVEGGDAGSFVWTDGKMVGLGPHREASAINNRGQIVGSATTSTGREHAVLWTPQH
jgi:probable HAF family extracellular repeat protein